MSDQSKQPFVDAALEEYARLKHGDDTEFLDTMESLLDEVDANVEKTDIMGRKQVLWMGSAIAAGLAVLLIPLIWISSPDSTKSSSDSMQVAAVELDEVEESIAKHRIVTVDSPTIEHEPMELPEPLSQEGKTAPALAASDRTSIRSKDEQNLFGRENRSRVSPKPVAPPRPAESTVDELSSTLAPHAHSFAIRDNDKSTVDALSKNPGIRADAIGVAGGKVEVTKPQLKPGIGQSVAVVTPTSGGTVSLSGVKSDSFGDSTSPPPSPITGPATEGDSISLATVSSGSGRPSPVAATSESLTPYVGYNGTPDSWQADGTLTGANSNDVLHGGVSLSVDFGEAKNAADKKAKPVRNTSTGMANAKNEATEHAAHPGKPAAPSIKTAPKERYGQLIDNEFASPLDEPLSTFSVDVDTASYSNVRRMITGGYAVPADAVRVEEMINYFSYDYPQPKGKHPFAFAVETAECPWNTDHQLMRVGIQGKEIEREQRPHANLVFLIDVSGSMSPANKLPLVRKSMSLLIEELTENDTISIVVYAGSEGLCLPPTKGNEGEKILKALGSLRSGGSTNGGAGIQLAYKLARENIKKDGINRVILCTDGDFNVGKTNQNDLVSLVENQAKSGTYLSVLGFGSGNINDSMLEAITNKGNGNYFYIDSIKEGRKVLLQDMMSTLVTIAKDVKIQIEFNPAHVQHYRLIGYANRRLRPQDFTNDKVDAGEIGSGHSVTALYEIVPAGAPPIQRKVTDNLKYQKPIEPAKPKVKLVESDELCTVNLRYKLPDSNASVPMAYPVSYQSREWQDASDDYQFAAAVGLWGMLLRHNENCGIGSIEDVLEMAKEGQGADPFGRREEFIGLVKKCENEKLSRGPQPNHDVMHGGTSIDVGF